MTALIKRPSAPLSVERAAEMLAKCTRIDEAKQIRDMGLAIKVYARERNAGREATADAAEIVLRAERRIGELRDSDPVDKTRGLLHGANRAPRGNTPPLHELLGMRKDPAKKLAARGQSLARMSPPQFRAKVEETRSRAMGERPPAHVSHATGENEWYTPAEYIDAARKVMGGIDLDPASSAAANNTVKAKVFLSARQDGLGFDWNGRVWLNPPYAGSLVQKFAAKLLAELGHKNTAAACVLVNNATETEWFQALAENADAICFPKGRVRFWSPGKPTATPLQGQAVIYFGPHAKKFHAVFSDFGFATLVEP